jgi:hypothetical protein
MRALLYVQRLEKAARQAVQDVHVANASLACLDAKPATSGPGWCWCSVSGGASGGGPTTAASTDSSVQKAWASVSGIVADWALSLDDMVLPVVMHELQVSAPRLRALTKAAHGVGEDPTNAYRAYFVTPGVGYTPELASLLSRHGFLGTLLDRFLDAEVASLQRCLRRLSRDWVRGAHTLVPSSYRASSAAEDEAALPAGREVPCSEAGSECRCISIVTVEATGSDGHCGRQKVIVLILERPMYCEHATRSATGPPSTGKIVYKPFGGTCSSVLEQLLHGLPLAPGARPRAMAVWTPPSSLEECTDYCWAEFVDTRPCASPEAVERYYTRCGTLLAVAEFVGLSDAHFENIVCDGTSPVLVDVETLFQPGHADNGLRHRLLSTLLVQVRKAVSLIGHTGDGAPAVPPKVRLWLYACPNLPGTSRCI